MNVVQEVPHGICPKCQRWPLQTRLLNGETVKFCANCDSAQENPNPVNAPQNIPEVPLKEVKNAKGQIELVPDLKAAPGFVEGVRVGPATSVPPRPPIEVPASARGTMDCKPSGTISVRVPPPDATIPAVYEDGQIAIALGVGDALKFAKLVGRIKTKNRNDLTLIIRVQEQIGLRLRELQRQ